jgi:hypothetical protein
VQKLHNACYVTDGDRGEYQCLEGEGRYGTLLSCDRIINIHRIIGLIAYMLSVVEGESFSAGDVLLEIETDKVQVDVEA